MLLHQVNNYKLNKINYNIRNTIIEFNLTKQKTKNTHTCKLHIVINYITISNDKIIS